MAIKIFQFLSLFFTALAMVPALAHVLELPHKINLSGSDYLIVQQIYRGWSLLGIIDVGAILFTLILLVLVRHSHKALIFSALAAVFLIAMLVVFFLFTFPVNQQTHNWTVLPENWLMLRRQWEYSHAAAAALSVGALWALLLAVIMPSRTQAGGTGFSPVATKNNSLNATRITGQK